MMLLLSLLSSNDIPNKSTLKLQSSKVLSNFQGKTHNPFKYNLHMGHEIVPYRIVPSDSPTMGCWSRIEMIGEYTAEVREKLYHEIIMIELYYEIPEYIQTSERTYYLLRLPVDEYHSYD